MTESSVWVVVVLVEWKDCDGDGVEYWKGMIMEAVVEVEVGRVAMVWYGCWEWFNNGVGGGYSERTYDLLHWC